MRPKDDFTFSPSRFLDFDGWGGDGSSPFGLFSQKIWRRAVPTPLQADANSPGRFALLAEINPSVNARGSPSGMA